ncbi:hypothetical protein [Pontibacter vulgaris]|uniref:hypothetical protein n=1 Tax=Pontibacter vulgaris TaxID=2905679 RepID=UPI001FA807BF|nr:hypothetical protein [Pontibacter vulgaris]
MGIPATRPELLFMLVGERMADGFAMYRDVYDNTAPLSAFFYWIIDLLTGRSYLAYRLIAAALLLAQALIFNATLNRYQVYASKNYIPALLYLVMGSITMESDMLTPLLIGNTFIILSLPYLVTMAREGLDNSRLFIGGFILGLAALSYLPLTLFLLVGAFAIIFFASSTFRSFLLMLCGFAFPFIVLMTYYLYTGALSYYLEFQLLQPWHLKPTFIVPPADIIKIVAIPGLVLALALFSMASLPQRLVFQVKFQQLMVVWLVVSLFVALTRTEVSAGSFMVVLPTLGYFSVFFFYSFRKVWMLNVFFMLLLIGVVVLRYRQWLGLSSILSVNESALLLPENPAPEISGSTVLVLGDDISYYEHNKIATPYLNWQLSQRHFGNLKQYQSVYEIYQNFRNEAPAYIVDKAGLMKELKYKLPSVFAAYEPTQTTAVYKRNR